MLYLVASVAVRSPAARDLHIRGGHGEVLSAPTGEGVARGGCVRCHSYFLFVLVACLSGQSGCAGGNSAGIRVGNLVAVPAVVQLQNQAAVSGNLAADNVVLVVLVIGEAGIGLRRCGRGGVGSARQVLGIFQCVTLTIQILQIVLYLVASVAVRSPVAGESYIVRGHGELTVRHGDTRGSCRPAVESVPRQGRHCLYADRSTIGMDERLDALCFRVAIGELGGSGGNHTGVGIAHLEVGLFPVGNERQVAGGAGGDFKTQLSFLAAAGGAFAHGPAQELIAFPDRVNQGKAWRADIVIGGVGVGAAGPSGLIRAAVIQIIGNVELLQLQLEDNYVLGVVGGKDGGLGFDTVLQLIAHPQELLRLIRGYIHGELLGCGFDHVSVENHFIAVTELDPIGEVAQRSVGEDDLILHTTGQGEGFLRCVNNVVRVRAGGCDRLGNYPGADCACAGDGRADFLAVSGHILDGVVNVPALINLGIDGGILGQRLVKVKGGGEFRILVPADEIIAGKQIRLHKIRGSVIGNGNGSQGAVRILVLHLHNEIQADGRRLELGVEGQIIAGHGGESVGIAQAIGVIIPALEFIPGIQFRRPVGGIVVVAAADVRAEADIGLGIQNCGFVVICYFGLISIVVEFEYFYSVLGRLLIQVLLIGVTVDFFRRKVARTVVVCLGIPGAQRIAVVIRILQIVLNLIFR